MVHLAAFAAALLLYHAAPPRQPHPIPKPPIRLVSLVYVPEVPLALPRLRTVATAAPVAPVAIARAEPAPELPLVAPLAAIENHRTEAAIAPAAAAAEVPRVAQPKPSPSVVVGAFANDAVPARSAVAVGQVEPVGGFDRPAASNTRAHVPSDDPVVGITGFDQITAAAARAPESRTIREAGFGDAPSRERPRAAQPQTAVTPGGFDAAAPAQAVAKAAPPPKPTVIPVEVLSKPAPAYTEEARQKKIEGEVVLDVEFASSGTVRVLGVVRGLGHGLDEAAMRAAQQIQFKPAHDGGRPVDFRTTVHITFRLA